MFEPWPKPVRNLSSGIPSLNTITPTGGKVPVANNNGRLDQGWMADAVCFEDTVVCFGDNIVYL